LKSEVACVVGNSNIYSIVCHVFVVNREESTQHTVHTKNSSVDSERESHVRVAAGSFSTEISIRMAVKVNVLTVNTT